MSRKTKRILLIDAGIIALVCALVSAGCSMMPVERKVIMQHESNASTYVTMLQKYYEASNQLDPIRNQELMDWKIAPMERYDLADKYLEDLKQFIIEDAEMNQSVKDVHYEHIVRWQNMYNQRIEVREKVGSVLQGFWELFKKMVY